MKTRKNKTGRTRWLRRFVWFTLGIAGVLFIPMLIIKVVSRNVDIVSASDVTELPGREIEAVIVPGARVLESGNPSGALLDRILLAQVILSITSADQVFASGAAGEPEVIAERLSSFEVTLDPTGFSTVDTCRNAAAAGLDRVAIVTQPRHRGRTAALCSAMGLDPVVVTTPDARERLARRPRRFLRERLAEGWALALIVANWF